MYIFETEYAVGFNKRELNGEKFLLGFVIQTDKVTNGHFRNWIDSSMTVETFSNSPTGGFKIFGSTRRSKNWFGSGKNMIYVQHPTRFVFEISVENLLQILTTEDIVDQTFTGEYILAHEGTRLLLIPTSSDLYGEAIKDTHVKKNSNFDVNTLKVGDYVINDNKQEYLYLGKYCSLTIKDNWDLTQKRQRSRSVGYEELIKKTSAKTHYFAKLENDKIYNLITDSKPKIFKVVENRSIDVLDIIKTYLKENAYAITMKCPVVTDNITFSTIEPKKIPNINKLAVHQVPLDYSKIIEVVEKGKLDIVIKYSRESNRAGYYNENLSTECYKSAKILVNFDGVEIEHSL